MRRLKNRAVGRGRAAFLAGGLMALAGLGQAGCEAAAEPVAGKPDGQAAEAKRAADSACAGSRDCRRHGRCAATDDGTACIATSKAVCAATVACEAEGACDFSKAAAACVPSVQGCANSMGCKLTGECGFDRKAKTCTATSAGCKASALCQSTGVCLLRKGAKVCTDAAGESVDNLLGR